MRLRWTLCAAALLAAAAARRSDQDFEFDDDAELSDNALSNESTHARRPRRYMYDPHNPLCRALLCKKRELCLLRDAFTALCANKKDILRKGDVIVSGGGGGSGSASEEDADDVFYDAGARDPLERSAAAAAAAPADADAPDRCVGCGGWAGSGGFLCGSDNRTYSSLCRLDLHNCVRRPAPPVALACRGFCPCRARAHPSREWRRRKSEAARGVAPPPDRPNRRRPPQGERARLGSRANANLPPAAGSSGCALDKMANRLLDWFSVLMEEAEGAAPPSAGFPAACKPEVRWMFAHLDADADGLLSAGELYALRHDERERCLRPFLASCGAGRGAWCACLARAARPRTALARAARPCTALARAHAHARAAGGYVPACDRRGYYRARQCHAALGVCWCVDAHGAELAGSRARGEPDCGGAPADDEDGAGSGDAEPRY